MNIPETPGPFTADNITIKAIDLAAYVLNMAAKEADLTWKEVNYGKTSPAQAAAKMNEIFRRIQIVFAP